MILLVVAAVLVFVFVWGNIRRGKLESMDMSQGQEAEQLILETRSVAADFLACGELVRLLSREKYLGTISVRMHARERGRMGYTVCMYDTGDIAQAFGAFQKEFPQEDFPELRRFVDAYGRCYDAQRDALVYVTAHTARLNGEERKAVEREVYLEIAAHPLAQLEELSLIHTKNLRKE